MSEIIMIDCDEDEEANASSNETMLPDELAVPDQVQANFDQNEEDADVVMTSTAMASLPHSKHALMAMHL
jgi:hypothetical protein